MSSGLAELTWQEAERAAPGSLLAVPLGATEQHGPHLPLGTDTAIAVALAEALAQERAHVLVAPALAYGSSGEHAGFAGTLSIGRTALELVLLELCRSACDSFARVLLLCAHGGNAEALAAAARALRSEGRDVRAWSPRFDGDAHAGRTETSIMLSLAPERVHVERACAGRSEPLHELLPQLRADGVRAVSASGILGDARGAAAEEGSRLLAAAAEQVLEFVDHWGERI